MTKTSRIARVLFAALAALVMSSGAGTALAQASGDAALISMDDAARIALEQFPDGTVESVELDRERGVQVYEVEVKTDRWTEHDVIIDARDGRVLRIHTDD